MHKLPRGLSCIIIGSIYHPPSANDRNMIDFLTEQLSLIESTYYNCGLILLGDFNNLHCHRLNNHFSLKQLVKFPTRGRRTLDLILTNFAKFYLRQLNFHLFVSPTILLSFRPLNTRSQEEQNMIFLKFATNTRETKQLSAPSLLNSTGQSLIPFRHVMKNGLPLNQLFGLGWTFSFPQKTIKKWLDDPPWMTQHLKSLIQQRQKALAKGHDQLFKSLRNRVNMKRKQCRSKYYDSKSQST